jgi:hypothetical protein
MMFPKDKRLVNKALLEAVRRQPCVACGRPGTGIPKNEAEHVSTKGAGNDDTEDNVWPLCRTHHFEKGNGFKKFLEKYPSCVAWLKKHNRSDVFERLERN